MLYSIMIGEWEVLGSKDDEFRFGPVKFNMSSSLRCVERQIDVKLEVLRELGQDSDSST